MMWFFLLVFLLIAVGAGWLAFRSYTTGEPVLSALLGPRAERRLGVVEETRVDGRRRLILIRRDDVEHLILTGGPVDVVVETGIGAGSAQAPSVGRRTTEPTGPTAQPAIFGRAQRTLEPVVNE